MRILGDLQIIFSIGFEVYIILILREIRLENPLFEN